MAPALFSPRHRGAAPPLLSSRWSLTAERWCQLFSEPGAGSDLASLAMKAVSATATSGSSPGRRCGAHGPTTPSSRSASPAPTPSQPKRKGIGYFLVDLRSAGVEVRELRHMGGEVDFNEVWLDEVRVPDFHRVGDPRAMGGGSRRRPSPASARWWPALAPVASIASAAAASTGSSKSARGRDLASGCCGIGCSRVYAEETHPGLDQRSGAGHGEGGRHPRPRSLGRKGPPGRAEPGGSRCSRRICSGAGAMAYEPAGSWAAVASLRGGGHDPEPGQHDRRRHDRGEQERDRREGPRPCPESRIRTMARAGRTSPR